MATPHFPSLDEPDLAKTRDALHAYARVLGGWLTTCRAPRKHWWQGSLRPSLRGLTTGVIYAGVECELELNLQGSQLHARTSGGAEMIDALHGQAAADVAERITEFLIANGLDDRLIPEGDQPPGGTAGVTAYSAECARTVTRVWSAVTASLTEFRAGLREETSPIQLWPHHFDLAMTWLPGDKVPGQDPDNEEYADKQMTFGFTLGDDIIHEPYFYVTAYPLPVAFPTLRLPAGTTWHTAGFSGAVLSYQRLIESGDARGYLLDLWGGLLSAGREHLQADALEQ
jgi:hypothetical protein